jgi:SAM-dependent methyltransferase
MSGRVINWTYGESDPGLMLWTASVQRWGLQWPCEKPRILELGCAEEDWLERMHAQNPDVQLTGVDVHPCNRPMTMTGSGFDPDLFAPESFDVVVMLGALEHFGLGFYGDPIDDDGDTKTMQNIVRWLAPDGWVYFDVPCQPTYSIRANRHFRDYSPAAVNERLLVPGLIERARGYSWPEPHAGTWRDGAPTEPLVPYWYVAVVADKENV